MSIILLFISVFVFFMTVSLFGLEYPADDKTLYDYVALGDSYSAGQTPFGDSEGYSYSDIIKDKLAAQGILGSYDKKGISGYTTTDLQQQLPGIKRILYNAEIVTLDIGINDILNLPKVEAYRSDPSSRNFSAAQRAVRNEIPDTESRIKAIIEEIKAVNPYFDPQIYIMGYFDAFRDLPEFVDFIDQLNTAISEAAAETGAVYVDTMAVIAEKSDEYFPGDIHPTVEGYQAIAEEFWKSISSEIPDMGFVYESPGDIVGHWAEKNIKSYMEKGIIKGYSDGSFQPNHAVTRAEFVTIINRFFRLTAKADIQFIDVPENAWYKTELETAVKEGYVADNKGVSFRADEPVTRQEAAVIIAKKMSFDLSEVGDEAAQFQDGGDIPSWSLSSVNALLRNDILKGYPDGSLGCQRNLTRAEVLTLLDNITAYINNNAPKSSDD
jgi:Lysophospholipase L1 and related esterases